MCNGFEFGLPSRNFFSSTARTRIQDLDEFKLMYEFFEFVLKLMYKVLS